MGWLLFAGLAFTLIFVGLYGDFEVSLTRGSDGQFSFRVNLSLKKS